MKPTSPKAGLEIICAAIERATATRIRQAILDDLAAAGYAIAPQRVASVERPAMTADERAHLHLQHPDPCPVIAGDLPYPIDPPAKLCRTSSWLRYRDETLLALLRDRPDDSHSPRLPQQAESVLAWRAGL